MILHWYWRNNPQPHSLSGSHTFSYLLAFVRRFQACEWMITDNDGLMLASSKGWKAA